MKDLLEQGLGVLLTGTVFGISMLVRLILLGYYSRVGKACKEFERTGNRTIVHIREDLNRRLQQNVGMKSALVYTECRIAECKVLGIRLGVLEGILEQSVLLVVLSSILSAFAGVLWGCEVRQILLLLFVGGVSFFALLLVDLFLGMREKHKRVRLMIRDFIENGSVSKPSAEKEQIKADKAPKRGKKQTGKAQEEKRRLTEELLRERRQLEARRFAEQKIFLPESTEMKVEIPKEVPIKLVREDTEIESKTKEAVQQVQAEAAATEVSYEVLLDEVLAEYLA